MSEAIDKKAKDLGMIYLDIYVNDNLDFSNRLLSALLLANLCCTGFESVVKPESMKQYRTPKQKPTKSGMPLAQNSMCFCSPA